MGGGRRDDTWALAPVGEPCLPARTPERAKDASARVIHFIAQHHTTENSTHEFCIFHAVVQLLLTHHGLQLVSSMTFFPLPC